MFGPQGTSLKTPSFVGVDAAPSPDSGTGGSVSGTERRQSPRNAQNIGQSVPDRKLHEAPQIETHHVETYHVEIHPR